MQDAALDHNNSGMHITEGDQAAPIGAEDQATGSENEAISLNNEAEDDMERDGPARARKRRPVDPVLPNKRRSYVKKKMGVLKGKVSSTCRVCCHLTIECHLKYWTAPLSAPLPSQVNLALNVACHAWPDMTDMCMCS